MTASATRSPQSLERICLPMNRLGQSSHIVPPTKRVEPVLWRKLLRLGLGRQHTDGGGSRGGSRSYRERVYRCRGIIVAAVEQIVSVPSLCTMPPTGSAHAAAVAAVRILFLAFLWGLWNGNSVSMSWAGGRRGLRLLTCRRRSCEQVSGG
jgi:hypothetical protein